MGADGLRFRRRDALERYGPGGNVAVMCIIAHPAVDLAAAAAVAHDEIVKYGGGYYC